MTKFFNVTCEVHCFSICYTVQHTHFMKHWPSYQNPIEIPTRYLLVHCYIDVSMSFQMLNLELISLDENRRS